MIVVVTGFIAALMVILFGVFVLSNNPKNEINRAFSSFSILFGIWALCLVFYSFPIVGTSELWIRLTYIFSAFGAVAILQTVKVFPNKDRFAKLDTLVELVSSVALAPFVLMLVFTHLFVNYSWQEGDLILTKHGAAYPFFYVVIIPIIIYGMTRQNLRRKTFTGLARTQYNYFFLGMCIFGGIAVVTDIVMSLVFNTTQYFALSPLAVLPLTLINTYLVIQYRLMDLRLAIKYIVSRFVLFLIFIVPILVSVYYYAGTNVLFAIAATTVPFLLFLVLDKHIVKVDLGTILDRVLYKREKTREDLVAELSKKLSEEVDLGVIVPLVEDSLKKIYNSRKISFLKEKDMDRALLDLAADSEMVVYEELRYGLSNNKYPDEDRPRLEEYKKAMVAEALDVVKLVNPKENVAQRMYLLIGEKTDLSPYTKEDLSLLNSLCFRITTTLEIAQLVEHLEQDKLLISAERNKLAMALAGVSDAVLALDHQRRIVVANSSANELLHLGEVGINQVFTGLVEFLTADEKPVSPELMFPSVINDKQDEVVYHAEGLILKQGSAGPKNVTLQISTIKEAAKTDVAYIVVIHDMTEEEQLERMKLDFVAMAAHELRTPLTSMKGYLSLFRQEFEDTRNEKEGLLLSRIETSTQQLVGLMDNLLSVSQIEQGEFAVHLEKTDWIELVSQQVEQLSGYAKDRNLELKWVQPAGKMPDVMVDRFRIVEVLNNLISNGLKYTHEGFVEISVEYVRPENRVVTHVKDTGEGIPPEAIQHMFKKFFRVWGQLEMGSKGTGLGLYIAKSIVDMHHGKIWVESEGVGKGSTFSFSLPVAD